MFENIWLNRNFIINLIRRDFSSRFIKSKIGTVWAIIYPLINVLIFTLVLSNVLSAKIPGIEDKYAYPIYLMSGILAWSLFSEILTRSTSLFIDHANLIKKISFPRIALPSVVIGSSFLTNFFLYISILIVFSVLGTFPNVMSLWFFPLVAINIFFAIGIGLTLGVLNVFIRDIGHALPIMLQLLFWGTPIIYPIEIVPEKMRQIIEYNPLYYIVKSYQSVFTFKISPAFTDLALIIFLSVFFIILSIFLFRKSLNELIDTL